jgi:hypothetical protein
LAAWEPKSLSAAKETQIPLAAFPEQCPYTWEQLADEDWLPNAAANDY